MITDQSEQIVPLRKSVLEEIGWLFQNIKESCKTKAVVWAIKNIYYQI